MEQNSKKLNIGIIGLGYVGSAIENFFSSKYNLFTYDLHNNCSEKNISALAEKSEIIFLCLPTPIQKDGSCSLKILSRVLEDLEDAIKANNLERDKTIIIKSTIIPGSSRNFSNRYKSMNIVFNPEFLTELNSYEDFLNQKRIILGGENTALAENLYAQSFKDAEILILSYEEAEMVKYFANTFLATKVAFANEMFTLCKKMNINYNTVVSAVVKDERIGRSHFSVPGPDGKYGFGGSCFPKDLSALIFYFNTNKIESIILNSVWERNANIDRKEKDWNQLKGRAVE